MGRFAVLITPNDRACGTITAHKDNACFIIFDEGRYLSKQEFLHIGSYPTDYNFGGQNEGYMIGMSVPPVMVAQIATKIYEQWTDVFN